MLNTPTVNRSDVLRVVAREFPRDSAAVLALLENVTCTFIGTYRLHLALLKLASGSLQKLQESMLIPDSRDVVSLAEYPEYSKRGLRIEKMSDSDVQKIVDDDWLQYQNWLNAK